MALKYSEEQLKAIKGDDVHFAEALKLASLPPNHLQSVPLC